RRRLAQPGARFEPWLSSWLSSWLDPRIDPGLGARPRLGRKARERIGAAALRGDRWRTAGILRIGRARRSRWKIRGRFLVAERDLVALGERRRTRRRAIKRRARRGRLAHRRSAYDIGLDHD